MTDITPTTIAIDYAYTCGFSTEYLCYLTRYSPNLLGEARINYISFMGPTLDSLIQLGKLHDDIEDDDYTNINPIEFIEQHMVLTNEGLMTIGAMWANDYITHEEAVTIAQKTDSILTHEYYGVAPQDYVSPRRYNPISAPKVGAKQVW